MFNSEIKPNGCTSAGILPMQCCVQPLINFYNGDGISGLSSIKSNSVKCILTDPPYLYLKGQKLEREFDERLFFSECMRVLKSGGFIILFGRGTSFYRWNTILADLGFQFKEEIVWNKSQGSSPLMPLTRVHETISIHSKGKASINKVKVPYLEMKQHDIDSIIGDIKRMRSILNNTTSLDAVLSFLENNNLGFEKNHVTKHAIQVEGHTKDRDRAINVVNAIKNGMNEKSIIRTDRILNEKFTKHKVTSDVRATGDRAANVIQSMTSGMNEKSIIKEVRDHYTSIHPTQKPVSLLIRLLNLTTNANDLVIDPFAGSCSTGIAARHLNLQFMGWEIDEEFYLKAVERIKSDVVQTSLF